MAVKRYKPTTPTLRYRTTSDFGPITRTRPEKGLVEPRYPSLPNLMKAKKKPVKVLTSEDLSPEDALKSGTNFESIAPPPPRPACKMIEGEPEEMAKELVRVLREEAKVV